MTDLKYKHNDEAIQAQLVLLPRWKVAAFGIFLLERAAPNFYRFQADTGAFGGGVIRGALANAWTFIESGNPKPCELVTEAACDFIAPDTEAYVSIYTSSALDAAGISSNLLSYIDGGPISLIVKAASLRRDSIDIFLQLIGDTNPASANFESTLSDHPKMQEELCFQDNDILFFNSIHHEQITNWNKVVLYSSNANYLHIGNTN